MNLIDLIIKNKNYIQKINISLFNQYINNLDIKCINILHILSKIHTLFNHSNYRQDLDDDDNYKENENDD